ncbi:MAG: hypothetical protein J2P15_10970 [Micromonosporaceae bacterium]|nr:hypothetical protein [Micromonosporaceae bacterium]
MSGPTWPRVTRLTGDELTALARALGAAAFPGVPDSSYDAVDSELHPVLDKAFLASLAARGLLVPDPGGDFEPTGDLAELLRVAGDHRVRVTVEQVVPAGEVATLVGCELMGGAAGVLRHWIGDPVHALELCGPGTTLGDALAEIVAPSRETGRPGSSTGQARTGQARRRRGRLAELVDLLPQWPAGRLRSTMMMRNDYAPDGVRMMGLLGVFDGGPGDLWLVHPCDEGLDGAPEDLEVFVEPVPAAAVDDALREFSAEFVPAG